MKHVLRIATVTVSLLLASAVPGFAAEAAAQKHTPLEEQMDAMGGAMKKLRGTLNDPAKFPEALELVAKIKTGAVEAKKHQPALAAEQPAETRAAYLAGYQKKMDELIAGLDDLAKALAAGDAAAAKAKFDALKDLQKAGHKDYKKD